MHAVRLIVAGGDAPDCLDLERHYESIIAADSGYDTALRLGLEPDLVVGDLDSTGCRDELIKKGAKPVSHDKDCTDLELAMFKGSGPYDLIGCGGGRLDHTLAALASFRKFGGPETWWTHEEVVYKVNGPVRIKAPSVLTFAFFTLTPEPVKVHSHGLVWELDAFPLSLLNVSISNRSQEAEVRLLPEGEIYMSIPLRFFPVEITEDA